MHFPCLSPNQTTLDNSPGFRKFGECGQAAGVHVSAHVDVHRSVGLGELCRCGDALVAQRRHRRARDHGPGHAGAIVLLKHRPLAVYSFCHPFSVALLTRVEGER